MESYGPIDQAVSITELGCSAAHPSIEIVFDEFAHLIRAGIQRKLRHVNAQLGSLGVLFRAKFPTHLALYHKKGLLDYSASGTFQSIK